MKYPGKRILLDVDGVLADFTSPIVTWINNRINAVHIGDVRTVEQITDWDIFKVLGVKGLQAEGFAQINARDLPVHEGAHEFLHALCTIAEVDIVTSPFEPSATWESDRRWWMKHHFGTDAKHVHFTNKKHLFKGDVLIDDGPHNINDFPGPVVVIDRPWNQQCRHNGVHARVRCGSYMAAIWAVEQILKGSP